MIALKRTTPNRRVELPVDVRGTPFQQRVWDALRVIPIGSTRSYGDVARAIGRPRAVRAVAQACARNPVALVVPCHRVVRQSGDLGGYRWGVERKALLLEGERAVRSEEHTSELQSRLHLVCRLLLEKKKKYQRDPQVIEFNKRTSCTTRRGSRGSMCMNTRISGASPGRDDSCDSHDCTHALQ